MENTGILWVVATPLGNPDDLSPRAREVLAGVDLVLAEDTRRSGLLMSACGVKARGFTSLHDHNEEARIPALMNELEQGKSFALVSDAGTPLLSDPGYRLVRACRERGIPVKPVPGPSAPLTALSASGIAPQPFVFLGFPPRKAGEQGKFFEPYLSLQVTLVFFERKDRVKETLRNLFQLGGEREFCLCRELTKTHEEFIVSMLSRSHELPDDLLGEITVVAGPPLSSGRLEPERLLELAEELLESISGSESGNDSGNEAGNDFGSSSGAGLGNESGRRPGSKSGGKAGRGAGLKPKELAKLLHKKAPGWSVGEIYDFLVKRS